MKHIPFFTALLSLQQIMAAEAPALKLVAEVKGFANPASVAWDGTYYYVSNVGKELNPSSKDGDGFISRMDANGANLQREFIFKLNAPKGLLVAGKTLYVCDIDVLMGFDLATRKKTLEISFAKDGVQLLNDVCAADEGKLLVSATDKNKIYLIDLPRKTYAEVKFDKGPIAPKGLAYANRDGERVICVAGWGTDNLPNGEIVFYTLDNSLLNVTRQRPPVAHMKAGYLDGVALAFPSDKEFILLYSNWVDFKSAGKLCCLSKNRRNLVLSLPIPKGPVAGPADFLYGPETSIIALPCMMDGRVLLLELQLPKTTGPAGGNKDFTFEELQNAEMDLGDLDRYIESLLEGILEGGGGPRRALSFGFLQRLGPSAKPAIPKLTEALKHKDGYMRVQAAYTLWKIDRQAAMIDHLVEALRDQEIEARDRAMAAGYLGLIGPQAKGAMAALTVALKDPDDHIRVNAAFALWRVDPPQVGAVKLVLMEALSSKDLNVFTAAVRTLAMIGFDKESVSALAEAIKADAENRGHLLDDDVAQALAKTLKNREVETRKAAIATLTEMNPEEAKMAVPELIEALQDPDATVRASAAEALKKIDPEAAAKAGAE
jgi:HEAT repeat protein